LIPPALCVRVYGRKPVGPRLGNTKFSCQHHRLAILVAQQNLLSAERSRLYGPQFEARLSVNQPWRTGKQKADHGHTRPGLTTMLMSFDLRASMPPLLWCRLQPIPNLLRMLWSAVLRLGEGRLHPIASYSGARSVFPG
jgi:hypothetical protein